MNESLRHMVDEMSGMRENIDEMFRDVFRIAPESASAADVYNMRRALTVMRSMLEGLMFEVDVIPLREKIEAAQSDADHGEEHAIETTERCMAEIKQKWDEYSNNDLLTKSRRLRADGGEASDE